MHWQRQKQGAEHYRNRMRKQAAEGAEHPLTAALDMMARSGGGSRVAEGKQVAGRMDVAVAIGTDPAMMFSSIVPAPPDVEEFIIAGFLRQKPVELVKCETVDLEVPAHSEIVLEGYVELDELSWKAPSAITPASTPWKISTRCFTSRALPTGRTRSTPPPSSASRPWRMPGWARQWSASSYR